MKKTIIFSFIIWLAITANAQTWRSAYYPSNWTPPKTKNFYTDAFLQDYSYAGYHRGEKNIPAPSGTIYNVTKSPYNADKTGNTDATAAIQAAINAAQTAGGGIVYLPTGTYKVSPGSNAFCLKIDKSNIIFKGDGIGKTFILNTDYKMNSKKIISVSGTASWTTIPTSKALLTKDVMTPDTVLSVDNTSLFKVGDLVLIRNVIGDDWITEHKETAWLTYGSSLRGQMYCRYITAIDATAKTITIDIPVRYALKTRDGSCVFKLNNMISEVGLQDFSIGNVQHPGTTGWGEEDYTVSTNSSYDCAASYVIVFNYVLNSWMKNISSYKYSGNTTGTNILSNGILVQYSRSVTIDSCTMQYAQFGGGGGNGYAYRISANECLMKNSIAYYIRHGIVFSSMWSSGNVIHKCRDIKTGIQCGNTGSMSTSGWGSDHHMHFSQSNLIDQCYSENSAYVAFYRPYGSAPLHNLTSTHTAYWNITSGGTKGYCVWTQQARYGYAIGTSGTSATIKTNENSAGSAAKTDPVDITEGQGLGATLEPQSLYLDQLDKRLNPVVEKCSVDSLSLIDATLGSGISGYTSLKTNSSINKDELSATLFNVYANTSGTVDSVLFTFNLNGTSGTRKEKTAPYAMRGDGTGYTSWNMPAGTYTVTASAYCGSISGSKQIAFTVTETVTAIAQEKKGTWSIHPNPAKDEIVIDLTSSNASKNINTPLQIKNMVGQSVFTSVVSFKNAQWSADISSLPNGIYFIIFDNQTKKLIINR